MFSVRNEPKDAGKKIGRITGKKEIDVFWNSNKNQVLFNLYDEWLSQKNGYILESLTYFFGNNIRVKKMFLSSGYHTYRTDSQSYYDIYDSEWSDLANSNMILHLVV